MHCRVTQQWKEIEPGDKEAGVSLESVKGHLYQNSDPVYHHERGKRTCSSGHV